METDKGNHVRKILQKLQEAYSARDLNQLDEVMNLFLQSDEIELIGISAKERKGYEWFQGVKAIREIISADWEFWGDVQFDIEGAKISMNGKTAWLSTTGKLIQTKQHDKAMVEFAKMMQSMLNDVDEEGKNADLMIMEATHFGIRRLRERKLGEGYQWPFTLTAVLVKVEDDWKFHTIHWAMPVD
ncbi:MAG TPA: nuclear transport factor 2 family protein [Pelolinea sp.]|nr:nuclear transport factor 2 family protein [Pelolinea sp.]